PQFFQRERSLEALRQTHQQNSPSKKLRDRLSLISKKVGEYRTLQRGYQELLSEIISLETQFADYKRQLNDVDLVGLIQGVKLFPKQRHVVWKSFDDFISQTIKTK